MSLRLCLTIILLSVVSGVYGASVAVDVLDPLAAIDNVTLSDNSTKSLNVNDSSALKIRDVDVQLREVVPMCQCTCTNVTDIAGAIKNAGSLDISTDKAQDGSDGRFLKVRDVGALQPNSHGFNLSGKLTVGNSTTLNISTDKAGNGSSNFTFRASLPPSVVARDVDVQLKSLEANVSEDMLNVNSTVNSTSDLSMENASTMEERGIEDIVPFDDALFDDDAALEPVKYFRFHWGLRSFNNNLFDQPASRHDFKASLEAAAASDDEDKVDDPKPSSSFSYFRPSAKKNLVKRLQTKKREGDLEKKKKEEQKEREDELEKKKKEERKNLFGKAIKVPNSFEKDLHCLAKKCLSDPVSKPAITKHLEKAGLWGRTTTFLENDDKLSVKNKIEQTFPELKGGFKMLKCNKNGKSLFPIGDGPLVDGRALKAVTTRKIYLCPIQKDIDVDEATSSGSSGEEDECNEECLVCGELVPLTLLTSHAQKCTVKQVEDDWDNFNTYDNDMNNWEPQAFLPSEALIKFEEHRERIMEYSDQEAYLNLEEKSNRISITRGAYVTDLMTASKNPVFIAKIKRPLVVTFVGEDGADGGGLRRNLLSMVIDHAKDVFYVDPDQVGIDQDELDELYFALSIFLGIAVIQEKLFPKFVLQTFNNLKSQYGRNFKYHPLNRGLALFDLDKVFEDKQFSALFADFQITVQNILESLNYDFKDAKLTPELKMCHKISFTFFNQLLNNIEKGKVSLPTRKMTLTDVFLFYTGLKTIPLAFEGLKYDLNYKLNDSKNRFRPIAYTCTACAQLTLPIVEKYEDMEEGWVDAVLNNENGFGLL